MEPTDLAKQVIEFQKKAFKSAFDMMVLIQDQTERANNILGRNLGIPEEGQQVIEQWRSYLKTGRDNLRKMVDEGLDNMEIIFSAPKQKAGSKKEAAKPE
jgi:hypothetical protein